MTKEIDWNDFHFQQQRQQHQQKHQHKSNPIPTNLKRTTKEIPFQNPFDDRFDEKTGTHLTSNLQTLQTQQNNSENEEEEEEVCGNDDNCAFEVSDEFKEFVLHSRRLRKERDRLRRKEHLREKQSQKDAEELFQKTTLSDEKEKFGDSFSAFCQLRAKTNNEYSQALSHCGGKKRVPWWPNLPLDL
eukprot:m.63712 g.63712  ORF g.63712 m.63712 type:complete len:187 (-) comp11454_c2_seq1:109-669(-)